MLLRIGLLSALGYAAYRYLENSRADDVKPAAASDVRLAGGPLSTDAFLVHADDELLT